MQLIFTLTLWHHLHFWLSILVLLAQSHRICHLQEIKIPIEDVIFVISASIFSLFFFKLYWTHALVSILPSMLPFFPKIDACAIDGSLPLSLLLSKYALSVCWPHFVPGLIDFPCVSLAFWREHYYGATSLSTDFETFVKIIALSVMVWEINRGTSCLRHYVNSVNVSETYIFIC